jgi:hypothetical protein
MRLKGKNKLILVLAFVALCSLFSCESGERPEEKARRDSLSTVAEKHRIDSLKRRNPLLIVPPDSNYTGTYVDKYDNGIVKFRGFFRQGQRHGQWMSFYPNGIAWSEMHYDKGKREGPNITYFEDGRVRYAGIYKNDLRDSIWVFYDSTGHIAERAVYEKDKILRKLGPESKK